MLKLKVGKFWRLIHTLAKVTGEKLVEGTFCRILNNVNGYYCDQKAAMRNLAQNYYQQNYWNKQKLKSKDKIIKNYLR